MTTSRSRGFTLLETTFVIALSVVIMLAITLLVYNFNKISLYDKTSLQSSNSAHALMREIESLALPANAVIGTHAFADATRTSSSTVLVLEIPSIDASGGAIANTYDYGAFYAVGANAYRILETNALSSRTPGTKKLSSTISTLTFIYNSPAFATTSAVTVDIQTQATAKQDVLSYHLREMLRLRNY